MSVMKADVLSTLSSRSLLHRSFALNKIVSEEVTLKRNAHGETLNFKALNEM